MKIKRNRVRPGLYDLAIIEGQGKEVLYAMQARNTGVRLGPNIKGWEYGPVDGPKKLAFSLREVEQAMFTEYLLSRVQTETA